MTDQPQYKWSPHVGYECSSRGDRRFSAFYARLEDGRSIEEHYQCDVKGYDPGGTNWRRGKGKPAIRESVNLWTEYLALWRAWARNHADDLADLVLHAAAHGYVLRDSFATTSINQAHALAVLLTERQQ